MPRALRLSWASRNGHDASQVVGRQPNQDGGRSERGTFVHALQLQRVHARVQTAWGRTSAPTLGRQGGSHDTHSFCQTDDGRARDSGDGLLIEQLAFLRKRRQPWHWRRAQPRGNDCNQWTLGNGWSRWNWGRAQPGRQPTRNDGKRWNHTTGNGRCEWYWRTHWPWERWRRHGWSVGLGRRRHWRCSDWHRRHVAWRLGRQWSLGWHKQFSSRRRQRIWIGRRDRPWIGRQLWRLRSRCWRGAKCGVWKNEDASERDP